MNGGVFPSSRSWTAASTWTFRSWRSWAIRDRSRAGESCGVAMVRVTFGSRRAGAGGYGPVRARVSGMTRRLRIAGTAFGALLVPACAGLQPDATVMHPAPPPTGVRPAPGPGLTQAAKPRTVEKFAEGRTEEPPAAADKKPAPT